MAPRENNTRYTFDAVKATSYIKRIVKMVWKKFSPNIVDQNRLAVAVKLRVTKIVSEYYKGKHSVGVGIILDPKSTDKKCKCTVNVCLYNTTENQSVINTTADLAVTVDCAREFSLKDVKVKK